MNNESTLQSPRYNEKAHAPLPCALYKERARFNRALQVMCVALLVMICAPCAKSIPLETYRERVRQAIIALGTIGATTEAVQAERLRSDAAAIAEMRRLLPAGETIEWSGMILHADNSWLEQALSDYERMPPTHPSRAGLLARIGERLTALHQRLTELGGQGGRAINNEEEKARLAAILRRAEYNSAASEENALSRLWKRFREWFRKLFPRGESTGGQRESPAANGLAQFVVLLLSLAVITYVCFKFLPRFLRRDLKKRKREKGEARIVLGERLDADETAADLLTEAEKLALAGDTRGAIRKGYIALLCELHDRKILRLAQHKTNRDYLRAVQSNQPLHEEVKPMTASFESHWYGLAPATESDWQAFRARYHKATINAER